MLMYRFCKYCFFFLNPGRSVVGCYLEDLAGAPGPGHTISVHPNTYMTKAPHYSLGSKNFAPGDKAKKPGPGAHFPERVKITRPEAPRFSLGVRHSEHVMPLPDFEF